MDGTEDHADGLALISSVLLSMIYKPTTDKSQLAHQCAILPRM
jgi:hypothetical protein